MSVRLPADFTSTTKTSSWDNQGSVLGIWRLICGYVWKKWDEEKIPAYVKHELHSQVVWKWWFSTQLFVWPQVTPLEGCVSGVGTQYPRGFFSFNQVFPGFLTQVLGCSKWVCFILNQNHRDMGWAGGTVQKKEVPTAGCRNHPAIKY